MISRDAATEAQVRAADPRGSVWLSANAGSGKTRVLTDRVARLLLDGVSPQNILCLTYTKAAASEMQNRLFSRLGKWAMQDEAGLRENLAVLGLEGRIDPDTIARARRLFARAIETPGGLKIQTIHSFCAALLRRFPLEAGVAPQFREMDDRAAKLLREAVLEDIAEGPGAGLLHDLAYHLSGDDPSALTAEIVKHQELFESPPDRTALWQRLGLAADDTLDTVLRDVQSVCEPDAFRALYAALQSGSSNDVKAAARLALVDPECLTLPDLEVFEQTFLSGPSAKSPFSAKVGSFPTKATQQAMGAHIQSIDGLMQAVEDSRMRRISLCSGQKTLILHKFARQFLSLYQQHKARHGWLDFDDLILKARALLTSPEVAQWVLFRIDGGIDHILVDEAQDTSPAQWDVIERLAQEFSAGQGARDDVQRTIFVVGDKKQSIYSFQGADPDGFDRMSEIFARKFEQARQPFVPMGLDYSFRSAAPILRLVDMVFAQSGQTGLGGGVRHFAFKSDLPGRVDLWPAIEKTPDPEPGNWYDPVDRVADNKETVVLANQIADQIAGMIGQATLPEENEGGVGHHMRHVRAGDILILVQRRSELFHELIRACKTRDLPIAGADRLKIGAELAVRDITALLSFLSTAEDDLSLACALRSPLFGWSQQELHALAQPRPKGQFLWAKLREAESKHQETLCILQDLRREADFLRPYDLIERVLTRHGGRKRFLARLGPEAEDGIDALLAQALSYEQSDIPSLTGFITWLASDEVEIKRQPDSAGNRIRVMTVHGAKGLEAPIVILPDTAKRNMLVRDEILPHGDVGHWKTAATARPEPIARAHERIVAQRDAEQDRLLYVAMTRAEKWLIVAGAGEMGKDGRAWYEQVREGMEASGAAVHEFSFGQGLRLAGESWPDSAETESSNHKSADPDIPAWATSLPPEEPVTVEMLSPSDLGGTKALPGDAGLDEETAMRRGSDIHLLLEHLPAYSPDAWPAHAEALLNGRGDVEISDALDEATQVLNAPHLAHLFGPDTLAEVDLTASILALGDRQIMGTVDRLIVTDSRVLAVDYKTNATVPDSVSTVPDGLIRQMAAYHAALSQIYPDHQVEVAILWTRSALLMPIPHEIVRNALDDVVVS